MMDLGRLNNTIAALSFATITLIGCEVWAILQKESRPAPMTLIVSESAQKPTWADPDTGPSRSNSASGSSSRADRSQTDGDDDQDDDDDGSFDPGDPEDPVPI